MGAEQSKYDGPPEVLEAKDLSSVAKYMKSAECRRVFVMVSCIARNWFPVTICPHKEHWLH